MSKALRIAVDFDGTLVDHRFPDIGRPIPEAFEWLRKLKAAGAVLILWTMRSDSDKEGPVLTEAVKFCREHGIEFDGINEGPGDRNWTTSPKAYAHVYVDDAALGCPLYDYPGFGRLAVHWETVGPMLLNMVK